MGHPGSVQQQTPVQPTLAERRDGRWVLRRCARRGHILGHVDDAQVAAMTGPVGGGPGDGPLLRCLRCGTWMAEGGIVVAEVIGTPAQPAALGELPLPARGPHGRRFGLLRLIAAERWIRGLLMLGAGVAAFQVAEDRGTILSTLERLVAAAQPLGEELGLHITQWSLFQAAEDYLGGTGDPVRLAGVALIVYGILQVVEGVGLWSGRRWAEYLAVVVTSAFVPLEVYEIVHNATPVKWLALAANLAIVVYLVYKGRLFGLRGGHSAFLAELRDATLPADLLRSLGRSPSELTGTRVI